MRRIAVAFAVMALGLALVGSARASYRFPTIDSALSSLVGVNVALTCETMWEWPNNPVVKQAGPIRGYWWAPDGARIRPDLCGQVLALFVDPKGGTDADKVNRGYALRTAVHESFHYLSPNEAVTECRTMKALPGFLDSLGVTRPDLYMRGAELGHASLPGSYLGGVC